MVSQFLSTRFTKYSLEIKYIALAVVLLGSVGLLAQIDTFHTLDGLINYVMHELNRLGIIGIFLLGLLGNISLLIQVPYTLPLLSTAVNGSTLPTLLLLGLSAGLGSTFGKMLGYHLADQILAQNQSLTECRFFVWFKRFTEHRPRLIPWLIFIWAFSPLPDDSVIVPLAMIRYGARRLFFPLLTGKILHSVVLAWIFYEFTDWSARYLSPQMQTDAALGILIAFVAAIGYQYEKGRALDVEEVYAPAEIPAYAPDKIGAVGSDLVA